jgi:peroxiredoxin
MSLQNELDAVHNDVLTSIPREGAIFDTDTEALARSGAGGDAPKLNDRMPAFELPDQLGRRVHSDDLIARGPLVVSFYRGSWCPYCSLELRALQQHLPRFAALGASLVAIGPQVPDESLSTAEKFALSFPVLSDLGNAVARRFGLVFTVSEQLRPLYAGFGIDLPRYNGTDSFELPIPATFVVDRAGIIRAAHADPDYKRRMEPEQIIDALTAKNQTE